MDDYNEFESVCVRFTPPIVRDKKKTYRQSSMGIIRSMRDFKDFVEKTSDYKVITTVDYTELKGIEVGWYLTIKKATPSDKDIEDKCIEIEDFCREMQIETIGPICLVAFLKNK